jgi:cellulose synthase (UDP-forming)
LPRLASRIGVAFRSRRSQAIALFALLAALVYFAAVPLDQGPELWLGFASLGLLAFLRRVRHWPLVRLLVLTVGTFLCGRYLIWRVTTTIHWHDPASFVVAIALFLAEFYGMLIFLLGMLTNVQPIARRSPPITAYPTVDVLIPTYNEPPEILEVTLVAATQIRYPEGKLRVYLCDDGGTRQRTEHPDAAFAQAARDRQKALQALCAELGATYLTRERNEHSKAGNLNAALPHVSGELVLVLDADHIPTVDFLERTVGFFETDPEIFLVQTPHFFINPDPLEKNLDIFGRLPSENEMFYSAILPGLDFWNSAFFCGSAAVLRRSCLDEVGGIHGVTITEDAETALELHARGHKSVYLNYPLISGLQPETYSGFITQRVRWAQGMVQIFLLKNPLFMPGLTLVQRLCYFSSTFFWFFGYARIVFLLAPAAFLVFGLKIYDATAYDYLAYAVPYVATSVIVSDFLFGRVRWTFISEVYELLQALYALPGIMRVFVNPRAPVFAVTPKGEYADRDFVSDLSGPFYPVYILTLLALAMGVRRWFVVPQDHVITGVTMGWEVFNLLILNASNRVLYERRQRRSTPRMPANLDAFVVTPDDESLPCKLADVSVGGAFLKVDGSEASHLPTVKAVTLVVMDPATHEVSNIAATLQNSRRLADGSIGLGVQFSDRSIVARRAVVSLAHGDSSRWHRLQVQRRQPPGIVKSFVFLLWLGTQYNGGQLRALVHDAGIRLIGLARHSLQRVWPVRWTSRRSSISQG